MRLKVIKAPGNTVGRVGAYPWRTTKVGGQFEVRGARTRSMRVLASAAGARTGRKFSVKVRPGDKKRLVVKRVK